MKSHSDFIVGRRYVGPSSDGPAAFCVGHASDGHAVLELNKGVFAKVFDPSFWTPAPKTYKRYVNMYEDGPGSCLYVTYVSAKRAAGIRRHGFIKTIEVSLQLEEES